MREKEALGLAAVAVALIFAFSSVHATEIDDRLTNLGDNETIKIVISLDAQNQKIGLFGRQNVRTLDDRIDELRDNYNVNYIAQTFNGISMTVTKDELEELSERSDVKSIYQDFEFKLMLQDSVPLINASAAHSFQTGGINLTGEGQTICIIDSGINYTHQAFGGCTTDEFLAGNCSKVIGGYAYYNNVSSNRNDVMGDSNHGTHVAGIAAGLFGVAPDAKIVAIKACGPTLSCDGSAVVDGINWCVSNSEAYNISVISMSLGTSAPDLFDYACDSDSPAFSAAINSAVAKNISVIAATGNDGNQTHISLPACITNSTAVSWTDKSDIFAAGSNRNAISLLVAPGTLINSSLLAGGYGSLSGTSMATPYVAGAVAIIRQAMDLASSSMTASQITLLLNRTGKRIMDSTGINYSRIDLQTSLLEIDTIAPEMHVQGLVDEMETTNSTLYFGANASDWKMSNLTFRLFNNTGDMLNETAVNISGSYGSSSITLTGLANGTYNWTFTAIDSRSNVNSSIRTFQMGLSNVSLTAPADGYNETNNSAIIGFNFTVNAGENITNCTLISNGNAYSVVNVSGAPANYSMNASFVPGTYIWSIRCDYDGGNVTSSDSRTFTVNAEQQQQDDSSSSGGSRSGGGGGGGTTAISVSEDRIPEGYTKLFRTGEVLQFNIPSSGDEGHTLTVNSIGNDTADITIRSDPIRLILLVGQDVKLNVTSSTHYDLIVRLENIFGGRANITLQSVNDIMLPIASGNSSYEKWNISLQDEPSTRGEAHNLDTYVRILVLLAVLIITFIAYRMQQKDSISTKSRRYKHRA